MNTTERIVEYRGRRIDVAMLPNGDWQANVDGRDVGSPQRSAAHAIERGRAYVNRSLGKPRIAATRLADDDQMWERLRDMIRTET